METSTGHLDASSVLPDRQGVGIDIHLHDGGLLGVYEIERSHAGPKLSGSAARSRSVTPMRSARCRDDVVTAHRQIARRGRSLEF